MIGDVSTSKALTKKANNLIPGGAHTYSKGDDRFPADYPLFIESGKGARCRDVDGNEFVDWGMGLRTVILGHAYEPVLEAVRRELPKGSNFTRPAEIEVELAELMVDTIKGQDMVKFGKNGSDANGFAVRLARAYTGREKIAVASNQDFFCVWDWFIGMTSADNGIPRQEMSLVKRFEYNNLESVKQMFEENPEEIALVILQAATVNEPEEDFLKKLVDMAHSYGALVLFDEIITGFRWSVYGAQNHYGITPDLSTFGKAMANGFSVSALMGKQDIMELGGIKATGRKKTFTMSLTHGAETHALAAAIATINELKEKKGIDQVWKAGGAFMDEFNRMAKENGIDDKVYAKGVPCSPYMYFDNNEGVHDPALYTLFNQETIKNGVLMPWIAPAYMHQEKEIEETSRAIDAAFSICRKALEGNMSDYLHGEPVKPVFRKYI